jgi:RimJ/RimL family protein N-acetyltransferase
MIRAEAPETIATPRLILRKPRIEDAAEILASYAVDPEVARYLTWKSDQTLDDIRTFLRRALQKWDQQSSFTWAILLAEGGQIIGMIDLRLETNAQLGYLLAKEYWNRGIMTEAVRAVVSWAMTEPEVSKVWAVCETHNSASARVLEKAGLTLQGILPKYMVFPNLGPEPRDCFCYARLKSV